MFRQVSELRKENAELRKPLSQRRVRQTDMFVCILGVVVKENTAKKILESVSLLTHRYHLGHLRLTGIISTCSL